MTQPLPPDVAVPPAAQCTAHRYALNTWYQGVAHPRHHCTDATNPHPTRPHVCACGEVWPGVGVAGCSHCGADAFAELRIENDGKGHVVYLCTDRAACAAVYARNNLAASMRTLAANSDPATGRAPRPIIVAIAGRIHQRHGVGWGGACGDCMNVARLALAVVDAEFFRPRPVESDSAAPGVPEGTDDRVDAESSHVAGALGIVVGLLNVIRQADVGVPPMRTIVYGLGMAKRELEQATAGEPPHIRQPGDPVGHLEVTGS